MFVKFYKIFAKIVLTHVNRRFNCLLNSRLFRFLSEWKYNLQEGRKHDPINSRQGVPRLRGLKGDFIRGKAKSLSF